MGDVSKLEQIRRELEEIDKQILALLAKRLSLVRELAQVKLRLGLPVLDPSREEEVRKYWLDTARELGVPSQLVSKLVDLVLDYSKVIQAAQRASRWRDKLRIAVIGQGSMGYTLYSLFRLADLDVVLISARDALNHASSLHDRNFVIFTTRPDYFSTEIFRKVIELLPSSCIVSDILSVKEPLFKQLEDELCSRGLIYISMHPLFGPLDLAVGENIVLIPSKCCSAETINLVKQLFEDLGLRVSILTSPEEHDYYMSFVQVAHHVYYLAMMRLRSYMERSGIDFSRLCTHSFRQTLQRLERFRQLLTTLLEIQLLNRYAPDARKLALKLLEELVHCLDESANVDTAHKCVEM